MESRENNAKRQIFIEKTRPGSSPLSRESPRSPRLSGGPAFTSLLSSDLSSYRCNL
ncbi:hypothetical protein WN51_11218 [Melipona quadrifasciata]|uniref:Uncharacterized protein n=1 Tax=Melipona quadrifasciata TaxID=166423 RepID=A0A0M9A3P0_9HYME|nr:hypothetical protein WN51_11218 [Melipona quadrifasciata]